MRKTIRMYGHNYIYHFTPRDNYALIASSGGLMPVIRIQSSMRYGGNQQSIDLDRQSGMNRYVHLCFLSRHPMVYTRMQEDTTLDFIWLRIDATVLDFEGVCYCAGVANAIDARLLTEREAIETFDFDYMYDYHDFNNRDNRDRHNATQKYEILVPRLIPIELIHRENGN